MKKDTLEITSAKQALRESKALKSCWSWETRLNQRILIYIASLLEQSVAKPKRKTTPWQTFLGKALRSGKSIQQAGAEWKAKKKGA